MKIYVILSFLIFLSLGMFAQGPPIWLGAHTLRRGVGIHQRSVLRFKRLKFAHQAIVFGIRYDRVIEGVVAVIVMMKPLGELFRPRADLSRGIFLTAHSLPVRPAPETRPRPESVASFYLQGF